MGCTPTPGDVREKWDCLVAVLVVVSVWLIPLTVAFQEELEAADVASLPIIERVIDAIFVLHVLLNFRTAFRQDRSTLVTDARAIGWNYLKVRPMLCFPCLSVPSVYCGSKRD